jgi:hypothetical protein
VASCCLIPLQGNAQEIADTWYVGAGWSQVDFDDEDVQIGVATGVVGYNLGPNFAIEGRLGAGVSSDTLFLLGTRTEVDIKNYYGLFLRGSLPASDAVNVYAILGYGSAEVEVTVPGFGSASDDDDSEAYGAGVEFRWGTTRQHGLAVEWARYFEDSSTLSAIYRIRF